jgi:hypothetical protein
VIWLKNIIFADIFFYFMNMEELLLATENLPEKQAIVKIIDLKINQDMREVLNRIDLAFEKVNTRIDHLEREMLTLHQTTNQRINYLIAAIGIVGVLVISVITPLVLHFLSK